MDIIVEDTTVDHAARRFLASTPSKSLVCLVFRFLCVKTNLMLVIAQFGNQVASFFVDTASFQHKRNQDNHDII